MMGRTFILLSISLSIPLGEGARFSVASSHHEDLSSNPPAYLRISDSPHMYLPEDIINLPPAGPPEYSILDEAANPIDVEVYDIQTGEISVIPSSPRKEEQFQETLLEKPFHGLLPPDIVLISEDIPYLNSLLENNIGDTKGIRGVIGVDGRTQVMLTTSYPWRTIGRLIIVWPDLTPANCTGSTIGRGDNQSFHVLTAGHCIYSHDHGGWPISLVFVPGLNGSYMPYGSAFGINFRSYTGWTVSAMREHDWGVITLDRRIGNHVGWMGRETHICPHSHYTDILNVAGYPGDKQVGTMWHSSELGKECSEYNHWYWMDTFSGMSGAPVWRLESDSRYIHSVHTLDIDMTGANSGTRLDSNKYNDIITWIDSDIAPLDKPDLIDDGRAYSGFTPVSTESGGTVAVWSDIRNIGTAASGAFSVSYYASLDTTISDADHLICTDSLPSISSFYSTDSGCTGPVPAAAGMYFIGWIIDLDDVSDEFSETNNTAHISDIKLTVQPECPGWSGDVVVVEHITFSSDMTCECVGSLTIATGGSVTVENGAALTIHGP